MGIDILWQPIKPTRLYSPCPSSIMEVLREGFGDSSPMRLGEGSLDVLKGMSAHHRGDDNPYDALRNAIIKHGTISLWTEC